jgi:hypothetical protein
MEQKMLKFLLIQLKLTALGCVGAMIFFLFAAFHPAKKENEPNNKHSTYSCGKDKEQVRESLLIGNLFTYGTLDSE